MGSRSCNLDPHYAAPEYSHRGTKEYMDGISFKRASSSTRDRHMIKLMPLVPSLSMHDAWPRHRPVIGVEGRIALHSLSLTF